MVYTLHTHKPRGYVGLKFRPRTAHGALGPDKTTSTTRKGLCFCFWATFHNLFRCVGWQLRRMYPSARHCLLLFPQRVASHSLGLSFHVPSQSCLSPPTGSGNCRTTGFLLVGSEGRQSGCLSGDVSDNWRFEPRVLPVKMQKY